MLKKVHVSTKPGDPEDFLVWTLYDVQSATWQAVYAYPSGNKWHANHMGYVSEKNLSCLIMATALHNNAGTEMRLVWPTRCYTRDHTTAHMQ